MSEEFQIKCQGCSALYNDLQDKCPYCGEPQPNLTDNGSPSQTQIYVEPLPENNSFQDQHYFLPDTPDLQTGIMPDEETEPPASEELFAGDALFAEDDDAVGVYAGEGYEDLYLPAEDSLIDDLDDEEPYLEDDYSPSHAFTEHSFLAAGHYADGVEDEPHDMALYDPYAGQDQAYEPYTGQVAYDDGEQHEAYHPYGDPGHPYNLAESAADLAGETPAPRRFTWRRMALGCITTLICMSLFYGGIGLMAVRQGLAERATNIQTESQDHYQKGRQHLADSSIDLAIAEFQMAISINPNLLEARQALREAQKIALAQPTPTSETRSAAAAELFAEAEAHVDQEAWAEAAETLSQVRDLDPDYQADQVSDFLYEANLELGRQLIVPNKLEEALAAFERALAERPDDPEASREQMKASLYVAGMAATDESKNLDAVEHFSQLYEEDESYLDVRRRLRQAHELAGDELAEIGDWCLAEVQYTAANTLRFSEPLQAKLEESTTRCEQEPLTQATNPTSQATAPADREVLTAAADQSGARTAPPAATPTAGAEAFSPPETNTGRGSILFSAFNQHDLRWEIVSVPADGGSPKVLVTNGTMPALSPNGQMLLYHSELIDSEGLHILDLTTGEDRRVTLRKRHILPRWGGNNSSFLLVAEEPGTGRWQVQRGFADGKSEPLILLDGRTPDWSPNGSTIAYQGTNPQGNEPGIYLILFEGGEPRRLTDHESDRLPMFSPNGTQLAYMSTRSGNWDIYIINTSGGDSRQLTTNPSNDGLAVWSPDGTQIAYVSDAGGSWGIYTIRAEGGTPAKVTNWDSTHPDWLMAQIWWTR